MSHDTNASSPPSLAPRPGKKASERLVRLTQSGERKALERLRSLIHDLPTVGPVRADHVGDIGALARDALVRYATGGGAAALSAELTGRNIDASRAELAGPNPSPLERLLAERVALCWFDPNASDRRYVAHPD